MTEIYILFAVARWLLCLLSDYKSATCSEKCQFVIRQRLYLIGEQEYLIEFTKISNRVQCDSINSNNTSHASACIQIKHKNSSMKHTVTLHYPTINMVWF